MKVWRKQTIRYLLNGKQATKATTGAIPVKELSKRFYGTLRLANGKRKQTPLTDDKKTSLTLLRRLQTEQDERRANGVDRYYDERRRPVLELLDEYEAFLRAKGNTPAHVQSQTMRSRRLLTTTKTTTIDELEASKVVRTLSHWRQRKQKPLNVQTSNHYLIALKGFSRWLWQERKTPDDALAGLRRMNPDVDRRRVRRALTVEELQRLLLITQTTNKTYRGGDWHLTAADRVLIYAVAAYTGLRCREIATLRRSSFDFDTLTLTLEASNVKNRKRTTLPLSPTLAAKLRPVVERRDMNASIWCGSWGDNRRGGLALKRDLQRAGISRVDAQGRYADFHSLRYTFITSLARAGVHPAKAQRLARHSTPALTLGVYTTFDVDDLREAVASLPALD